MGGLTKQKVMPLLMVVMALTRSFAIYCHTTPSGKRYIGQTCQSPEKRWRNGDGYRKCPFFKNAINKYGWDNIEHAVLCWCSSKDDADYLEQWFIDKYDTSNPEHGYNLTKGGGGGLGREASQRQRDWMRQYNATHTPTAEQRKKISETLKRKFKSGELVRESPSEEAREKNRIAHTGPNNVRYGTHVSEETRARMSAAQRGRKLSDEQRKKLSAAHLKSTKKKRIPVYQFTLDGEFIASYGSMKEAERETGIFSAAIRCCCIGKSHQSGGYIWCYQDKPETFPSPVRGSFIS